VGSGDLRVHGGEVLVGADELLGTDPRDVGLDRAPHQRIGIGHVAPVGEPLGEQAFLQIGADPPAELAADHPQQAVDLQGVDREAVSVAEFDAERGPDDGDLLAHPRRAVDPVLVAEELQHRHRALRPLTVDLVRMRDHVDFTAEVLDPGVQVAGDQVAPRAGNVGVDVDPHRTPPTDAE